MSDKALFFEFKNDVYFSFNELERLAELDFKNADSEEIKTVLSDEGDNKIDRMMSAADGQFVYKGEVKTEFTVNKKPSEQVQLADNYQNVDDDDDFEEDDDDSFDNGKQPEY